MLRAFAQSISLCRYRVAHSIASGARAASGAAVQRSAQFAELNQDDVAFFRSVLGAKGVVTDPDALEPYNQ